VFCWLKMKRDDVERECKTGPESEKNGFFTCFQEMIV
jgi:hypothetical protein